MTIHHRYDNKGVGNDGSIENVELTAISGEEGRSVVKLAIRARVVDESLSHGVENHERFFPFPTDTITRVLEMMGVSKMSSWQ